MHFIVVLLLASGVHQSPSECRYFSCWLIRLQFCLVLAEVAHSASVSYAHWNQVLSTHKDSVVKPGQRATAQVEMSNNHQTTQIKLNLHVWVGSQRRWSWLREGPAEFSWKQVL